MRGGLRINRISSLVGGFDFLGGVCEFWADDGDKVRRRMWRCDGCLMRVRRRRRLWRVDW